MAFALGTIVQYWLFLWDNVLTAACNIRTPGECERASTIAVRADGMCLGKVLACAFITQIPDTGRDSRRLSFSLLLDWIRALLDPPGSSHAHRQRLHVQSIQDNYQIDTPWHPRGSGFPIVSGRVSSSKRVYETPLSIILRPQSTLCMKPSCKTPKAWWIWHLGTNIPTWTAPEPGN